VPEDHNLDPGNLQRTATQTSSSSPCSSAERYPHQEQVEQKVRELSEAADNELKEIQLRELAEAEEALLKDALGKIHGVRLRSIVIPGHTFLVINQESTEEEDIEAVVQLCGETGVLFDGEGDKHLLLLAPDRQPHYFINGLQALATKELLELAGVNLRKLHLSGTSPLATDIALNQLEARAVPLNITALLQRIVYTLCQLTIECRGRFKCLVTGFKKAGARRADFALSRDLLTLSGRQVANQLLGYGNNTHNDSRSLWLQIERIKSVQLHSIRVAFKRLKALRKKDRNDGRSVVHLADFNRQLKVAEESIEKQCEGHKNNLLALSVKQIHAGKRIINKLTTLRVPPLEYLKDKEAYEKELTEACTVYYDKFVVHWSESESRILHNLILHFVFDPRSYCTICDKVLCDYRAERDFNGTECELYATLKGVEGLCSDLRGDNERYVNALFPLPLLQDVKGKTISLFELQRNITLDERLITQVNIRDQATLNNDYELGLHCLSTLWSFQVERAEERLENACGIVQLAASIPNSSHNNHEFERLDKEIRNTLESLFCPITADIGEDGDATRLLLEKLITEVVTYQRNVRAIEKGSKSDRHQLTELEYKTCQEIATLHLDTVAQHIFSAEIRQQIFTAPCTTAVSIVITYLYHEVHRNANAAYSVSAWDAEYSTGVPTWAEILKAYIDQLSGRTPNYQEHSTDVLAEEYLEQRRIAGQQEQIGAAEPEVEEITAAAEAVTDLSVDTDEDQNATPRDEPVNSFVVIAEAAPVYFQTCGTTARTQAEEYLLTVENSISQQPILCAYTANIRQRPEDPNDSDFQDGQSRRVRRRTDDGATETPTAIANEVNETQDASEWQQYLHTVGRTVSAVERGLQLTRSEDAE
jgi:hypothetical protein